MDHCQTNGMLNLYFERVMKDIIYIFYFSRDFRAYGPIDPYTNPMPTTGKFLQILQRVLYN